MRRVAFAAVGVLGLAACSLLTELDGLSGGAADGAPDGGAARANDHDAAVDAPATDAPFERSPSTEAGIDAEGGQACGVPGPTQGLLAYYPFDEGTGNDVHDCSGHGIDGTFVRQAAGGSWIAGKKGGGIRVQSPNGCVNLGTPSQLQSATMTVATWLEIATLPTPPASGYIIGQTLNADTNGWRIASRAGSVGLISWENTVSGTKYIVEGPWPTAGTWHHLTLTFAPSDSIEIFIDGTSAGKLTGIPPITFTPVSLRIGCRADDANYFDGTIDELRVYDRVLTASEIAVLAAL